MKGVYIHNQLEYRLEVAGEDFCQGDRLACSLAVKNHGAGPHSPGMLRLSLMDADLKKLKERKEGALTQVSCAELPACGELAAGEQRRFDWSFELDRNCPISDKSRSLCFVYGSDDSVSALGQQPFVVLAHCHIQKVVSFFESPFQFVCRGQKSAHGEVQVKLKPPSERRLSLLDELLLGFRFDNDALVLNYHFRVKAFDTTATSVNVRKARSEVSQRFEPRDYLLGEYLNHDYIERRIQEALAVVSTGI